MGDLFSSINSQNVCVFKFLLLSYFADVERLILPDMSICDHQEYKALSVTADNWMPRSAVPPSKLCEFLRECRRQGYTLVGVEQTSDSVPLQDYHFAPKSVLVLGSELQGLPAPVIAELDACVEIPQFGFVRSLNVHVSGALALWEYTRQMLYD